MRAQLIIAGDVTTLEDARESAAIIVAQTRSMTRIISEILSFARRQPPRLEQVDLVSVARNAIALSEHTARSGRSRSSSARLRAPFRYMETQARYCRSS
jgi:nitrogen fixation/metabolism regulation signal transduction histidine kinase